MFTKKHIIIYSHGFGVRKDDNGLLDDIAESLNEVESILFDYYEVDEKEMKMYICPFSSQVKKLSSIINEVRAENSGAIIDLICHSQGTIIAALAKPEGIRKAILLAPVFDMNFEQSIARYRSNPDAIINLDGVSEFPSSNGLVRIIPKEYWQERLTINSFKEYNKLSEKTELIIIEANQDQLLPKVDLQELDPKIKLISLDGDHGFSSQARSLLVETIRELLLNSI